MSLDGESNDASEEQSNNEQLVLSDFLTEKGLRTLMSQAEPFIKSALENFIRGHVEDRTELATKGLWTSMNRNSEDKIQPRNLKLKFVNKIPGEIFTGKKIVGEEVPRIEIALVDSLTGQVVKSGPVASAKVEIVVLKGDFGGTNGEDWTLEEFDSKIVKEMPGRKSVLVRNELNLKEGIGLVSEVSFTHNSSHVKNSRFRLGAKVVGHFDGIKVKEAKTEPFTLKDFRATYLMKHNCPSLQDEVFRLKGIAKRGPFHNRLIEANIETVQHFLDRLSADPQGLQQMHNRGRKRWREIVDHAQTADPHKSVVSAFKHRKDVAHFDDESTLNDLNPLNSTALESPGGYNASNTKTVDHDVDAPADAQNLVKSAYEHRDEVVHFDDEASLIDSSSCLPNAIYPSNSSSDGSMVLTPNKIGRFDNPLLNASSPDMMPSIFLMGTVSGLEEYGLHGIDSVGVNFDHPLTFPGQVSNPLFCETGSVAQYFGDDEHLQYFDTDGSNENPSLESQADLHTAVNGFLMAHSADAVKAQRRWRALIRVLRCSSLLRKLYKLHI